MHISALINTANFKPLVLPKKNSQTPESKTQPDAKTIPQVQDESFEMVYKRTVNRLQYD